MAAPMPTNFDWAPAPPRRPPGSAGPRDAILGPAVAVFEPDDIIQFGSAHLEDDTVRQGLEAMARPRRQVLGFAHRESALPPGRSVIRKQQPQGPLVKIDRLVLSLMILQAERFARADTQDLAGVTRRVCEHDLFAPGLGHACHAQGLT